MSLATFSAVSLVYAACWPLSSGSHPWPECRDKITRKVDSFDTSLALRVVNFLENEIQTTKADLDVQEEFPPAKLSLGEMFNECNPILGIGFLETDQFAHWSNATRQTGHKSGVNVVL